MWLLSMVREACVAGHVQKVDTNKGTCDSYVQDKPTETWEDKYTFVLLYLYPCFECTSTVFFFVIYESTRDSLRRC